MSLVEVLKGWGTSGNGNGADGRDHWPYCYTGVIAGAGIKRGYVHGESDKTGSSPLEDPVHPRELLATIYHGFGINPETIVYNHLNQPRSWSRRRQFPSYLPEFKWNDFKLATNVAVLLAFIGLVVPPK